MKKIQQRNQRSMTIRGVDEQELVSLLELELVQNDELRPMQSILLLESFRLSVRNVGKRNKSVLNP